MCLVVGKSDLTSSEHSRSTTKRWLQQLRPHIQSGLPVYIGTNNHALVACGLDTRDSVIVHDDQLGPYLKADRLVPLMRSKFTAQIPKDEHVGALLGDEIRFDAWWQESRKANRWQAYSSEIDLAVLDVISAYPPRVFQPLDSARGCRGLGRLQSTMAALFTRDSDAPEGEVPEPAEVASVFGSLADSEYPCLPRSWTDSTVLAKGIMYKGWAHERLEGPDPLIEALSWVQLSEWVTVVELIATVKSDEDSYARVGMAEIVYDASSDHLHPRILVLRVGNHAVFRQPGGRFHGEQLYDAQSTPGRQILPFVDVFAQARPPGEVSAVGSLTRRSSSQSAPS